MEIKKGISQMAEYPNVEINYVLPKSGNMHYVLKDGVLDNGVIIATLDPRHAIDEANPCQNIGAFSATGDILIDFNKKEIKKITDNLLLAVNSVPITNLVAAEGDMTAESNRNLIVQMMMQEMGPSGEMIFEDPYSEANVYATDSYNNKLGLDCSFIGKNNEGLYFHTNDVNSLSKFIKVDEFTKNESLFPNAEQEFETNNFESDFQASNIELEQIETDNVEADDDLQLNINPTILGGFNVPQDETFDIPQHIEEPTINSMNEFEQNQDESNINDTADIEMENPEEIEESNIEDSTTDFESEMLKDTLEKDEDSGEQEENKDFDEESNLEEEIEENDLENAESDLKEEKDENNEDEEKTSEEENDESDEESNLKEEISEDDKEEDIESEEEEDYDYEPKSKPKSKSRKNKNKRKYHIEEYEDEEEDMEVDKSRRYTRKNIESVDSETEILDDAIDLINKMMDETDRLNRRIRDLEEELDQKEDIIKEQKELIEIQNNKKNELNTVLNKASKLLDSME